MVLRMAGGWAVEMAFATAAVMDNVSAVDLVGS